MNDPLVYVRAVHFAATILAAGVVFFAVFIAEPAFRKAPRSIAFVFSQFAWIAWISLAVAIFSGTALLVLTAASMSGQTPAQVFSGGVLSIVLRQTEFGNDWLVRFALACCLAATFIPLFAVRDAKSRCTELAAAILAAAFVGALAWSGHAIGGEGIEGIVHPTADVLHLIAAAAWVGALIPLALLLKAAEWDSLAAARTATLRFSTLGIASVATILVTGGINTWYLVGSKEALLGTDYGRLLSAKIALFIVMVAIAAINRLRLTPRLVLDGNLAATRRALRQLRRNAAVEAAAGATIIAIVGVLGTLPPASHVHHHAAPGTIPADASFQHIHTENGMADVTVEPGHVGIAGVTIRLWDADENPLEAQAVTLTLTPPAPGSKPITRFATLNPDGLWQVDDIRLSQAGNWTVTVNALLSPGKRVELAAPIVIDAR